MNNNTTERVYKIRNGRVWINNNYKDISVFIEKHGCKILFLDFPLTDFGGLVTITEKAP